MVAFSLAMVFSLVVHIQELGTALYHNLSVEVVAISQVKAVFWVVHNQELGTSLVHIHNAGEKVPFSMERAVFLVAHNRELGINLIHNLNDGEVAISQVILLLLLDLMPKEAAIVAQEFFF